MPTGFANQGRGLWLFLTCLTANPTRPAEAGVPRHTLWETAAPGQLIQLTLLHPQEHKSFMLL